MDEQFAREVMSGRKRGLAARLLRGGLWCFQWPYRAGVAAKNLTFNIGLRKPFDARIPVISVGNLTTGGTGKTPVVAFVANWFRDAGLKVGLLSRGYKTLTQATNPKRERGPVNHSPSLTLRVSAANDEKLVLDQLCPGVPHWLSPDRIESAQRAVSEGCQLLILDDAFQHRRIHRDLDIVLIDATNPWGYGHCLPRGLLREPISALSRASLVLVTRADLVTPSELTAIRSELVRMEHVATVVEVAFRPTGLLNSSGVTCSFDDFRRSHGSCLAACGIGNPEAFQRSLKHLDLNVSKFIPFPDHHHFTPDDLVQLAGAAQSISATSLLVTQKDLVKIAANEVNGIPIWAVQIGVEVLRGASVLEHHLFGVLNRHGV